MLTNFAVGRFHRFPASFFCAHLLRLGEKDPADV